MRVLIIIAIIAGFGALAWGYSAGAPLDGAASYRFAAVERTDLAVFTIATGRIEAIDVVEVSSQLSGQVSELFADFNDAVEAEAPLARLDEKTYAANVFEAEARLTYAQAETESAVAATSGAIARYEEARMDYERKQALEAKGTISAQAAEGARANMLMANSAVSAARAGEAVKNAAIKMAQAALSRAMIDLDRAVIRAPIAGTVIRRSVELGQTVAVSMEAPTLFTIAHNLSEMEVHARVDEADIGQIRTDQAAYFSVDAYPDRNFSGRVLEIHRAPDIIQNVVTYTVVITAENPDLALLPGMTAVVRIVTTERPNALLVPNAALRFKPEIGVSARAAQDGRVEKLMGSPAVVWERTGSAGLTPVAIGIGISDGSMTEVLDGLLTEGQEVAIGESVIRGENRLFGLRLGF